MSIELKNIEKKLQSNDRINIREARWLYQNASNNDLKNLAKIVRNRYHKPNEATWVLMSIVNFTNICVAKCDFCAFYRLPHQKGTYTLSQQGLLDRVENLATRGGNFVAFNGGFNPKLSLATYKEVFGKARDKYPGIAFYEMTIPEFMFYCKLENKSYEEGAKYLKDAGTQWIPGGGAEILEQNFRSRHSPGKFKVDDFYKAQNAVVKQGLGTTATMVIGMDETLDERLFHLEGLRNFQDETNGTPSFLCWTYKPYNTELGGEEVSDQEYFRWLAICRIYLDNIRHIRTSILTKNENALTGLDFGANDFDIPLSDEVMQKAGGTITEEYNSILDVARTMGYKLTKRSPFKIPNIP